MKAGTKILIKETCNGCRGAQRHREVITTKQHTDGLLTRDPGFNVELENGEVWRINPDAEVEVLEPVFGKHLLRDGVIVKRRDDSYAIVIGNYSYSKTGQCSLSQYNNDLECIPCVDKSLDIMSIYEPYGFGSINTLLNGKELKVIAKRPEEVKEMTLAEVCKELGYNVKIVKEV